MNEYEEYEQHLVINFLSSVVDCEEKILNETKAELNSYFEVQDGQEWASGQTSTFAI